MTRPLWFKRKRHGWGWTPATTEGYLVVGFALAVVIGGALVLAIVQPSTWVGPTLYVAVVLVTVAALLVVTIRTGPTPRWRWGAGPDDDPHEDA